MNMNSDRIACMQNVMGQFVQNIYLGHYEKCAGLFSASSQTQLNWPDSGLSLTGYDAIKADLSNKEKAVKRGDAPREIYILCTPAFKADQGTGAGMWNAYAFKYFHQNSRITCVEPSFYRFDCDFMTEAGREKIVRMDCCQVINWKLLKCSVQDDGICEMPLFYNGCACAAGEDFVQIENLISRMTHSAMEEAGELFLDNSRSEFHLSAHMDLPAVGIENIQKAVKQLNIQNPSSFFRCVPYTASPVIAAENGHGWGRWMAMSMDFCEEDYENTGKKPWAIRRIGFLDAEFLRKEGEWKILKYSLNVREIFAPRLVIQGDCKTRWSPPALKGKLPAKAEDVFEIQSIIPEWTQRLMCGRLQEFPGKFMAPDSCNPTFWLGAPGILQRGYEAIMNECRRMDATYQKNVYKTPIIHTAMTPLIEVSECGTIAWAQWMDQCCSDLSQMTGDYTLPLPAMMNTWKYQHVFKKVDGHWKLLDFRGFMWSELEYIYADPRTWKGWVACDSLPWPMPFEHFGDKSFEKID